MIFPVCPLMTINMNTNANTFQNDHSENNCKDTQNNRPCFTVLINSSQCFHTESVKQ